MIVATFRDYGVSYDEAWRSSYGEMIISWYTTRFEDARALTAWLVSKQGGFQSVMARLATRVLPFGEYESGHLVYALFALAAVVATFFIGRRLAGSRAGLLAAAVLCLTPRFYGHAFINPVDIPFAATHAIAIACILAIVATWRRIPLRLAVATGIVIGLSLAIRVQAVVLMFYLGAALLACLVLERNRSDAAVTRRDIGRVAVSYSLIGIIAYVTMLVWWPAAAVSPIRHPVRALRFAAGDVSEMASFRMLFEGQTISTHDVPWYYVLKWFLLTLPELYFVLAVAGVWLMVASLRRGPFSALRTNTTRTIQWTVVTVAWAFPVAQATLRRPIEYDEIRHYLFVFPFLALLAGVTLDALVRRLTSSRVALVAAGAVAAAALLTAVDLVRLHPLQYVYFNRLVAGGLATAAKSYDTDYWGVGYKNAAEWALANPPAPGPLKVASCLHSLSTGYYLRGTNLEYLGTLDDGKRLKPGDKPDLFFAVTRWGCEGKLPGGCVIHEISREGAPLVFIKDLRRDPSCRPRDATGRE